METCGWKAQTLLKDLPLLLVRSATEMAILLKQLRVSAQITLFFIL